MNSMNFQSSALDDENYSDTLIQPYHLEWASQLEKENNSQDYKSYDSYQLPEDKDERSANRFPTEDKKYRDSTSKTNSDRNYKTRHDDKKTDNYRHRSYDRSPRDTSRKSDRGYSPDSNRSAERDRRSRRHSRDRSRRYSRSHSRERSRRYSRSRSRSRSRSHSRSRSRRSHNRDRYYDDDRSRYGRKTESNRDIPSNTIMLRGLAQHITQEDIVAEVMQCNLETKQIRLIRKKFTGASRGFAFVEFNTIEDAQRWMEMKQGSIMFQDQYRALMQFAVPREASDNRGDANDDNPEHNFYPPRFLADWTCNKCGGINFKRRENCFKCSTSRQESALGLEGSDEISDVVTNRIIIQNLDVLTKEEGLRAELESRTPGLIPLIVSLAIARDSTTSLSRGLAYLTFKNEDDSKIAYDTLNKCEPPFTVDSKAVIISYCLEEGCKRSMSKKSIPKPSRGTTFTIADVPKLAQYSAELYAKNTEQKQQYLMYYTNYYMQQIAEGIAISMPQTQSDETNSAAAVAHQAIMKMQNKNRINNALDQAQMGAGQIQVPTGTDGKVYAIPDISSYYYDQSSGYYYDVLTGLYYDPNTQYYYNSQINKFLYWDNNKRTYLLAPEGTEMTVSAANQQQTAAAANTQSADSTQSINSSEPKQSKNDKVKVAKRIAKDMERWAKTLNQKKENSKRVVEPSPAQYTASSKSATADICFSMVEKSERGIPKYDNPLSKYSNTIISDKTDSPLEAQKPIQPQYTKTVNESKSNNVLVKEQIYIDFEKLACLICKRQFASREMLIKHTKMSLLHKQNLAIMAMDT